MTANQRTILAGLLSALLALAASARAEAAPVTIPNDPVGTFLRNYCVQCHGPKKTKGQVRFDELPRLIETNDVAQRWQDVLDVLNGAEMPPEDEKQPPPEELAKVLDSLTGTILKARQQLTDHGGEIAMRRLNRREYAATIEHLFGFRPDPAAIPADDGVEPFDTIGNQQYFTSSHFDKYLALGREILENGFLWAKRRDQTKNERKQLETRVNDNLRAKLAELDKQMQMKKEGKTWQEMGFADAGEAEIIFRQFKNRAGGRRRYLEYPQMETGVYLCDAETATKFQTQNRHNLDPRATWKIRIRGGIHGKPESIRHFLRVDANDRTIGVLRVKGTDDNPEVIEVTYRPNLHHRHLSVWVRENRPNQDSLSAYLRRLDKKNQIEPGGGAAIWLDWIEIDGPYHPEKRSFFDHLVHPEPLRDGQRARNRWQDKDARAFIERFTFEAFRRRQPAPDYLNGLLAHFQSQRQAGKDFEKAMTDTLAIVLASPGFLYLHEAVPADSTVKQLAPREVAIRLAYFLWSAPPDDTLYQAATTGDLQDKNKLHAQVVRMLKDPRSRNFAKGFASQWGELDRFDAVTVDEKKYPRFNDGLRHSAKAEVIAFVHHLVQENLPVANLIDANFAMLSDHLAHHYDLPLVNSNQIKAVQLPADSARGGIMTQTAFLATGSTGERSSPVIRGALVMDKLLHDPPAPPPPNVPELGAGINKPTSNRDLVKRHQEQPQCASCHKKMDVIGFALENFDAIGQWRDVERVGRRDLPINPAGTLPDGSTFTDVRSLKKLLLAREDALARGLTESLMAYALGRSIEFSDGDDVDAIMDQLKDKQYRLRDVVHAIVANPLFHQR